MGNDYVFNITSICIHGEELLTLAEQDEISGLETIGWENHSWKYLSLMVTNKSSIFSAQSLRLSRFCIVSW